MTGPLVGALLVFVAVVVVLCLEIRRLAAAVERLTIEVTLLRRVEPRLEEHGRRLGALEAAAAS